MGTKEYELDSSLAERILDNAKSLLSDAKTLRQNMRYATALGLAILSLEEVGKYIILTGLRKFADPRHSIRLHKPKQRAAADVLLGSMLLPEIAIVLDYKGSRDFVWPLGSPKSLGQMYLIDVFAGLTDEEYDALKPSFYGRHQNKIILWLCRGDF